MSRLVKVFKVTTSQFLDESEIKDRIGHEEVIDVVLLEEGTVPTKKDITCVVELKLPKEYKKLLTNISYYKKQHVFGEVLNSCKSDTFLIGGKTFRIDVIFCFGMVKENGWIEIILSEVVEGEQLSSVDMLPFNKWSPKYEVLLKKDSNQYVRVIVK